MRKRKGSQREKHSWKPALQRLRPILMTAIATTDALIPLALGFEGGSQVISKGLGVTVIGGLISSTLLTLLIVPIVYEVLAKFRRKKPGMEEE
ncbi:efflux RND transporter permease subunit [Bacillus licheniformis]